MTSRCIDAAPERLRFAYWSDQGNRHVPTFLFMILVILYWICTGMKVHVSGCLYRVDKGIINAVTQEFSDTQMTK